MIDISNEEMAFMEGCGLGVESLEHICTLYDIGKLKCLQMHFENTSNINILIESTKGKYVTKFFHIEPERYLDIINYMESIQRHKVPVILPLRNLNGDYLANINGYKVHLAPYIISFPFKCTRKHMLSSGEILKRLHTAVDDDFRISEPAASVYPSLKVFDESKVRMAALKSSIINQHIPLIESLYERIVNRWEALAGELPLTVIHGDWRVENQLFSEAGDIAAIIDFDFVQRRERLFDIAYALFNFSEFWSSSIISSFFQGYGPLTEHETEILNLAVARVSFFFLCTASFSKNAVMRLIQQLEKQLPIIEYVLSDSGKASLINLCKAEK